MDISWMPKKLQKKFEGKGLGDIVKDSIDTVSAGKICLLYTSPSPRDRQKSRMPSSA